MIILGSTGSIGVQALQIIKSQNLRVEVLCAGDNIDLLNAQIAEFRPKIVVIKDRAKKDLVRGAKVVLCGDEGIIKALNIASSDFVLNALVGFSGVRPSLEAIRLGKRLALANKESLVVAGFLIDSADLARIIPVDSEHFALKELLDSMLGNSSLRADSQNLRGNPQGFARAVARSNHPPIEKMQESQGGLPRATSRARNDDSFLDSAQSAESVKNKSREAQPLALSGVGEGVVREGEGSDFAIQAPTPSLKENARGQKWESKADLSAQVRKEIDSADSQNLNQNNLSLRADSQNLRGNPQGFARAVARSNHPPIEKMQESQGGLPRATSRARNDKNIADSATRAKIAKSALDSAISKSIKKLFITASGGAFRDLPLSEIPTQRAESALKHPNWAMGRKITIDSASMINKVFEILEAKWLFGGRFCDFASFSQSAESRQFAESSPNIDAVIERTSTLHAIIQMQNNALLAHFSANDMRLPIASALLGDKAQNLAFVKELDLLDLNVRFEKIDCNRYPLWALKDEVLKRPKIGAIINAANDILVERFLQNQIYFGDISCGIFAVLDKFGAESMQNIDEILEINAKIKDFLSRFKGFRH